jgi:hypothetical protein
MAEPLNTATTSFDALYRGCARDLYAYVRPCSATTRAPRTSRRSPSSPYRRRASFDDTRGWLFAIARNAAARDALRVLEVVAGVALVALAVAAPLARLAALAVRGARRRRREGALDAS